MTEITIESDLRNFDYSVFSKVKSRLWNELLQRHRQDNANRFKSLSQQLSDEIMDDEELEYVTAAAGHKAPAKIDTDTKKF